MASPALYPYQRAMTSGRTRRLPMGHYQEDAISALALRWEMILNLCRGYPNSTERKAIIELMRQNLPPNELPEGHIVSLVEECANMIWNSPPGIRTWDSFREHSFAGVNMENVRGYLRSLDYLHQETIYSVASQFVDILRQKLLSYEFTGEDCPHENISSLIHQCADTTPQSSQSSESAGVRVYERNKPSVVRIDKILRRVDGSEVPPELGSGIVWDKRGHILTNCRMIRCGLKIDSHVRVKLADQSTYVAKVVFVDPDNDVAFLRINAPIHKLIPICVGNSADLRVGEKVFAFGNPFGFNHSLIKGVISALHREINSVNTNCPMQDMIQTDATINPGNSGGALLDRSGNFIGMNTSISSHCHESCGVGFAIPVDKLRRIFYDYVKQNVGTNLAPDQFVEQVGVSGVPILDAPVKAPASNVGSTEVIKQNIMALLGDITTFMKETKVPN